MRRLPWSDLQKIGLDGPTAFPGVYGFGLKDISEALGTWDESYRTGWRGEGAEELRAMVMGWEAYEQSDPLQTQEMEHLEAYLEADCRALWNVLRWTRDHAADGSNPQERF